MKHCVSSYADLCINGTYRVFAVQDTQHGRSTLGIYLDAGTIGIDQHRADTTAGLLVRSWPQARNCAGCMQLR